jgi:hypothetical protein
MRRITLTTLWLAVMAFTPSAADAQAPTGDSATGTGGTASYTNFVFDVRSGPVGENPTGTFVLDIPGLFHGESTSVTCLLVSGNTATFAGTQISNIGFTDFKATVVDNGPAGTGLDTYATNGYFSPQDCATPEPGFFGAQPLTAGDIVVVDAPPLPTSEEQCKNGGWRTYGVFKNQGDCVSFVATKDKNQPSGP